MDSLSLRIGIYVAIVFGYVGLSFAGVLPVGSLFWMLGLFALIGLSFPLLRGGIGGGKLLSTGVPATATLLGVRETGVEMGMDLVLKATLQVELPGIAPYQAECTTRVSRVHLGMLQPGRKLSVKVDPANPQKVAIDWNLSNDTLIVH
jgi:hypothetical protein